MLGVLRREELGNTIADLEFVDFLGLVVLAPPEPYLSVFAGLVEDTRTRAVLLVVLRCRVVLLIPAQPEVDRPLFRKAPPELRKSRVLRTRRAEIAPRG